MKIFGRSCFTLALLACCLGPVHADQLYVHNKPFKGAVSRVDGQIWVELKPLADALGFELVDNGENGFAFNPKNKPPLLNSEALPANKLSIDGQTVDVQTHDGMIEVPLEATAKLVNAKVVYNKGLGTIDVSVAKAAIPGSITHRSGSGGQIFHLHGRITVAGCNQVGLFTDGESSVPYKTGTVSGGTYDIEIDLDHDLHPFQKGMSIADMRFFRDGAFESAHGRCNFIIRQGSNLVLQVYEGPNYKISGMEFEYNEP
jgi:hypothetical protein